MSNKDLIGTIAAEDEQREVAVERSSNGITLWQDNDQPFNDAVWLSKRMARELRNLLSSMEL